MVATIDLWIIFFTSPLAYFMYFGIFLGAMFMYIKDNRPFTIDIFFGERSSNGLRIYKHKLIRRGTKSIKHNGAEYPIIPENSNLTFSHGIFDNPLHIIDDTWASDIQGIQTKYVDKDDRKEEDLTNMEKEINARKEDTSRPPTIRLNINPIFRISALKLYKYFEGRMLDSSFAAIVPNKIKGSIGLVIALIALGGVVGGMGSYIITNAQNQSQIAYYQSHETTIQTTSCYPFQTSSITYTNTSSLQKTTTTYLTTLTNQACLSQIISSLNVQTHTINSTSTTTSSSTQQATIVNQSSFTNGTLVFQYSNGTRVCVRLCA